MAALPLRRLPGGGIAVTLRVTPRGGATRIDGLGADAGGRSFLKLRVKDAPEKGKANAAVVKLLAKAWGFPPSALEIATGETGRLKTLVVTGADAEARLEAWFGEIGEA